MLRSLYSGVSGLDVNQKSMDVIGNNIANVNTIGFKMGRAVFQDLMSQTLIGGKNPTDARGGINPRQVGMGSYLAAVDNIFEPGVLKSTSKTSDIAIQGNGFFTVRGEGEQQYYYTRAGDFNFDRTGSLTTPSGYKVQGWMSDLDTGKLKLAEGIQDIVLGPAYKVMQAKASSEINLVGNLDTKAQASILQYPTFLTQAKAQQSFSQLKNKDGLDLKLAQGEPVKIKAHATGLTSMGSVFDASGNPLNLADGNSVTFSFPSGSAVRSFTLTYRATTGAAGAVAANEFSTMQQFITAVNANLKTTAVPSVDVGIMSLNNGCLEIKGVVPFEITNIAGSAILASVLAPLKNSYVTGGSQSSNEMNFIKEIKAGENFNNLSELGYQIESALTGSVIGADFNVKFLENNFGLNPGEGVQLNIDLGAGVRTVPAVPLKYTQSDPPALGEFNTLSQLAKALTDGINAEIPPGGGNVNVGVSNNKLIFNKAVGTMNITFGALTLTAVPGGGVPNPYLKSVFDKSISSKVLSNTNPVTTDPVAGKGRLVYTNMSGSGISGLSIVSGYNDTTFQDNLLQSSSIPTGESISSYQFLALADETSKVVDLFTQQGETFGFVENESSLVLNASIGGSKVTNSNLFSIGINTTVTDLMTAMENYLGLGRDHDAYQNVIMKNGQIVVTGEEGEANKIDFFRVEGATSANALFTKYMTPEVKQTASGGYYPTNVEIYDEQGNKHVISMSFSMFNKELNEWKVKVSTDDPMNSVAINGATSNEIVMKFNSDGSLAYVFDNNTDPSTILVNPTMRFSAANGTNTIPNISLNLGTPGTRDGITIGRAANAFTTNSTDGYAQGQLQNQLFNPAGEIVGTYSNGQVRTLGQLALAIFTNQQGLLKVGDTMFGETANSGQATYGAPQTGSRGDINAGMLENSNVDLSNELVSMITTQRGFQANSKVITTSDEMIQELLNMKR